MKSRKEIEREKLQKIEKLRFKIVCCIFGIILILFSIGIYIIAKESIIEEAGIIGMITLLLAIVPFFLFGMIFLVGGLSNKKNEQLIKIEVVSNLYDNNKKNI